MLRLLQNSLDEDIHCQRDTESVLLFASVGTVRCKSVDCYCYGLNELKGKANVYRCLPYYLSRFQVPSLLILFEKRFHICFYSRAFRLFEKQTEMGSTSYTQQGDTLEHSMHLSGRVCVNQG